MKFKAFMGIVLIILFVDMLTLTFNIHPVKASGAIYIRADGSVDPDTAPISTVDNVTYTFTDNIHDSIVVKRDNIVVDGAGYTLQGTSEKGITLSETNVTIKNMEIKAFYYGVYLYESSNNTISGNHITNNGWNGIGLYSSSKYNIISGNNITENNGFGIMVGVSSNYSAISGNNITNNGCGIVLDGSSNNNISGNNIRNNAYGISLGESSSNAISGNNITENNDYGITLCSSLNSTISGNNLINNGYGIYTFDSLNNFIYYNNFVDNTKQVVREVLSKDIWDDGYPSGGNFWSDYTGVDICSGPFQNETGSDGIGDTPYFIDADNQDNYPLMSPWGDVESPVADAGPDLTVGFGTTVTFDGSESVDDVAIKSYVWTFIDITPQTLTGMRPEYTFNNVGDYEVTLNVSDYAGNWNTDTVTVTVLPDFTLTIYGSPTGVTFTVDGVSRTTPWSGIYSENTSVSLIMPEIHTVGDARYYWSQWSDGNTSRTRAVTMNTRITLTAYYEPGPVYIRADGSVDPDTAPISSVDNVTYTFTDNIHDSIVVERDNIVVDGAGYTVQGTGSGTGIDLLGISNVTIKNTEIRWFRNGIWLYFSYNNAISASSIVNNEDGILVDFSHNNSISGNNITENNEFGIQLGYSSNNRVSGNNITNNEYGIWFAFSSDNSVSGNNITNNEYGIQLYESSNYNSISDNNMAANERFGIGLARTSNYNIISGNNITENGSGVEIYAHSSNNNITGNHITENNGFGIMLGVSSNYNAISGNSITNNEQGIRLNRSSKNVISGNNITARNYYGVYLYYYSSNNTISRNNITNNIYGIRLYYSSNNTIDENNITGNNEHGIWFSDSSNYNAISGNNITNNWSGILLDGSSNHNSVSRNNIIDNRYGIAFGESSYNRIYHNNFIDNTKQVACESLNKNVWDNGYPSGGNHWSYHVCTGNPSDGSQPYIIDIYNIDHYPFQDPNGWLFPQLTVTSSPMTGIAFTSDGVLHTTPYTNRLPEGSYTLEMPQTHNGYVWSHWLEDGDTSRIKTITLPGTTYTAVYTELPIGGHSLPIKGYTSEKPSTVYLAIVAILTTSFAMIKRKTDKRTKR